MSIKIEIVDINIDNRECVVKIFDNDVVVAAGNIGLQVNPDNTANTLWIKDCVRDIVFSRRMQSVFDDRFETSNSISYFSNTIGG